MISKDYIYEGGYIALPISLPNSLSATVTHDDNVYHLKDEFHISLVCVKRLQEMVANVDAKTAEEKILHLFKEYSMNNPVNSYTLSKEVRHVMKDERQTLVLMASVNGLSKLFDFINERLGTQFDTQPAHTTLYTLQPNKGIGILDRNELDSMTTVASVPEIDVVIEKF